MRLIPFLLLFLPLCAQDDWYEYYHILSGYSRVPTAMLDGRSLVSERYQFWMDAPNSDWEWLQNGGNFACKNRHSNQSYMVYIRSTGISKLTDEYVGEYIRQHPTARSGTFRKVETVGYSESDIPIPGSYQVHFRFFDHNGDNVEVYTYLALADYVYAFEHISISLSLPYQFEDFVSTFNLTVDSEPVPDDEVVGSDEDSGSVVQAPGQSSGRGFMIGVLTFLVLIVAGAGGFAYLQSQSRDSGSGSLGKSVRTQFRDPLAAAKTQENAGRPDHALAIIRDNIDSLGQSDHLKYYFDLAVKVNEAEDILHAGRLLIADFLKIGQPGEAWNYWQESIQRVEGAAFPHPLMNQFIQTLMEVVSQEHAGTVLQESLPHMLNSTPGHLFKTLELAVALNHKASDPVVNRLESLPNLSGPEQARLQSLIDASRGTSQYASPSLASAPALSETPVCRVSSLKRLKSKPLALETRHIRLSVGQNEKQVAYQKIMALGVGVIKKAGAPFLLIDLVLDPLDSALAQHRLIRLDSRHFKACDLVANAADTKSAFLQVLEILQQGSGAPGLPSQEQALGKPYAAFASVDAYEAALYFGS